jgi:hypothetical protein
LQLLSWALIDCWENSATQKFFVAKILSCSTLIVENLSQIGTQFWGLGVYIYQAP